MTWLVEINAQLMAFMIKSKNEFIVSGMVWRCMQTLNRTVESSLLEKSSQ